MVNTRIQRWAVLLAEYGVVIRYQKGKNNIRADMLSCIPDGNIAILDVESEWVMLQEEAHEKNAFKPSETDFLWTRKSVYSNGMILQMK